MINPVFMSYDYPVQIKTYLSSKYNYNRIMLQVPYFLLDVSDEIVVLANGPIQQDSKTIKLPTNFRQSTNRIFS